MKIRYDQAADAIFIHLNENGQFKTDQIINDNLILSLDAEGKLIGIELLNVGDFVTQPTLSEHKNLLSEDVKP